MRRLLLRFAWWILRSLGDVPKHGVEGPTVYALCKKGDRVAEVSTNGARIRAEAVAAYCRGEHAYVLRYRPVERWSHTP